MGPSANPAGRADEAENSVIRTALWRVVTDGSPKSRPRDQFGAILQWLAGRIRRLMAFAVMHAVAPLRERRRRAAPVDLRPGTRLSLARGRVRGTRGDYWPGPRTPVRGHTSSRSESSVGAARRPARAVGIPAQLLVKQYFRQLRSVRGSLPPRHSPGAGDLDAWTWR